ncbi:PAAR domain-containing protein [Caballeronia mineralivorans]|uniref:PAAR domain-containing protein n=1 Tax=Caballeronia mineralivorans TaxID=2010198 RepID=UPI0023F3EF45|nr:PAAR domain-containing protein [Caballeronia mineralivorans]
MSPTFGRRYRGSPKAWTLSLNQTRKPTRSHGRRLPTDVTQPAPISPALVPRLAAAIFDSWVRDLPNTSDHGPSPVDDANCGNVLAGRLARSIFRGSRRLVARHSTFSFDGRKAAVLHNLVSCPEHGDNPITEAGEGFTDEGRPLVVDRCRTQCGSFVIAQDSGVTIA